MKKRVLVYRHGSLGDTIMVLPCFHKIREVFPNDDLILLTNRPTTVKEAPLESIIGKRHFFDRILTYPAATRNVWTIFWLLVKLRTLSIDIVIDLTVSKTPGRVKRDKAFFRMAGIKEVVGFPSEDVPMVRPIDPETNQVMWEAKQLATRIETLGMIDLSQDRYWDLLLTKDELETATVTLSSLPAGSPIIVACVGTKAQSKDWEIHNWIRLFRRLADKLPNWSLVIIGSQDEYGLGEQCLSAWKGPSLNLCGKLPVRISASILTKATVFVGHDSGPMHLAGCVGTPCVAVFSARNLPQEWYPKGDRNKIIYHRTDCAGCDLVVCIEEKKKCILSITVDEVEQATLSIISKYLYT